MLEILVFGILLAFAAVDPALSHPQQGRSSWTGSFSYQPLVSQAQAPQQNRSSVCGFGYEILETRLEQLELKLQNILDEHRAFFNSTNTLLEKIVGSLNLKQQHSRYDRLPIGYCDEATATKNYQLRLPNHLTPIEVLCDMVVFGGRWLVIQQRLDGSVDFNRSWAEYRDGFGVVGQSSEFWLGLEAIHHFTKAGDHELLIELKNENGKYGYARYGQFKIAGENEQFQLLSLIHFEGTVLYISCDYDVFSTYDRNNLMSRPGNCARTFGFGSWFGVFCRGLHINGPYKRNINTGYGISWGEWTRAATYSRMLIRRK